MIFSWNQLVLIKTNLIKFVFFSEKLKLETELNSDEANVKLKESEIKSLQNEIETLHQMLKQLDSQKSEARKRLDDLAAQVYTLSNVLRKQILFQLR